MDENERLRLEEVANIKPSRLERRLAKNALATDHLASASDNAGFGAFGRILVFIVALLGIVAAAIPTLLYFAVILIPLFLMYTCVSGF